MRPSTAGLVPPPAWSDRADEESRAVLIPAHADPKGRDSLGRGLDEDSIAAVVVADRAVRTEKEEIWFSLRHAYRDPYAAKAVLDEIVKSQGWTSTAARLAPDPARLGQLLGRSGWFAGRDAELERAGAMGAARGVVYHLARAGEAEARAARTYRASVEAQREADAIPVPGLRPRAEAAVAAIAAAPDERARANSWHALTADKAEATERLAQADALKPTVQIIVLLGREIPVVPAGDGTHRAHENGKLMAPHGVRSYIARAFGERLDEVRAEMTALAALLPPEELNRMGFRLYEKFRPEVPKGAEGWGAKGVLHLHRIREAANVRRS